MLPPPAPSEVTATLGVSTGWPAISSWLSTSAAPSTTSETSNDVPPMSTQMQPSGADVARDRDRGDRPADRAREERVGGPPHDERGRGDAAVRLHHAQRPREPLRLQPLGKAREVARDHRRHVGRDDGGRPALVLAPLGRDLVRADDDEIGRLLADEPGDALLVRRVGVGVQQAHGDGVVPTREATRGLAHRGLVERFEHRAVGGEAARELDDVAAAQQHRRAPPVDVVHLGPVRAADLVDVAEARGDEHREPRAAAFEQRVQRGGRAVDEVGDGLERRAQALDCGEDAVVLPLRDRRHLGRAQLAAVEPDGVGEGPADVDGNTPGRYCQRTMPIAHPVPAGVR